MSKHWKEDAAELVENAHAELIARKRAEQSTQHRQSVRRKNDFYPTPAWATDALLQYVPIPRSARVLEPCAGAGDIASRLHNVTTMDIDPLWKVEIYADARTHKTSAEWVVTNPPFSVAFDIVRNYVEQRVRCCFLLRLSFLEPTSKKTKRRNPRGKWLAANPPCKIIVLPRISYTGDGKTDSVTCAWMCWSLPVIGLRPIEIVERKVIAP